MTTFFDALLISEPEPIVFDGKHPTPEEIRRARRVSGLTQAQAADLVHRSTGIRWSEWEHGTKRMQPDTYELFLLKTGQQRLAITTKFGL